jgi:hypothetical protein
MQAGRQAGKAVHKALGCGHTLLPFTLTHTSIRKK